MSARRLLAVVLALPLVSAACILAVQEGTVEELDPDRPVQVRSATRAFLADGSVVVYPEGARVTDAEVRGVGRRYSVLRVPMGGTDTVALALDSVLGLEAFREETNGGLSLLASVGTTALLIGGSVALICAADPKCFGSCPTVYSQDAAGEVLESEAFSYSISPLLEGRDLDRMSAQADEDGLVELEVRNEALETHFINHLELLEVRHGADERVVPDHDNLPLRVGPARAFDRVTDRSGRDVTEALRERDDRAFSSVAGRVATTTADDSRDWIEATLPATDGEDAAVVLRLRNSLLNTVLFYEFMLGTQGARALDWMARDIERIGTAVELGSWFQELMGLRLEVETDDGFEEIARLGDTGPIAWKEVAFRVPTRDRAPTRIRLSFLTDEWRIDRLSWADRVERPEAQALPIAELVPIRGSTATDLADRVAEADDRYLVTSAGTGFTIRFDAGPEPAEGGRTFLLGSQGYYTEWVRPTWIRTAESPTPFRPDDDLLPALMERWTDVMDPMEAAFHATRIPVR